MSKEYLYYKGEKNNPFDCQSDEAYFFGMERMHEKFDMYDREHIDILMETFKNDYAELRSLFTNDVSWEVVCLCIEDCYECGYGFKENLERIKRYGIHRAS